MEIDCQVCHREVTHQCDICEEFFCASHVKAADYYMNDADDFGYKLSENGEYDICEDCLND